MSKKKSTLEAVLNKKEVKKEKKKANKKQSKQSEVFYTDDDVSVFSDDRDRVIQFLHSGMYMPDDGIHGLLHILRELVNNSNDEAMVKGATFDTIKVLFNEETKELSVIDGGSGIPHGKARSLCEVLHAGAKFDKGSGKAYNFAGGQNGVGLKLVIFLSEYVTVQSTREGKTLKLFYKDGNFVKEEVTDAPKDAHGTSITYKPNSKYMKDIDKLTVDRIEDLLESLADACPGITNELTVGKGKNKYVKKLVGLEPEGVLAKYNEKLITNVHTFHLKSEENEIDLAFGYTDSDEPNLKGWINYIRNEKGGAHVKGLVSGVHAFMKKYMKDKYLKGKDKDLTVKKEDIAIGLAGVIFCKARKPEFTDQYKVELKGEKNCDDYEKYIAKFIRDKMKKLSEEHIKELAKIIRINAKSRESASNTRKKHKKNVTAFDADLPEKYIRASIKASKGVIGAENHKKEIFIVEGDSPGGAVHSACHNFYQEVYKTKGRVENIWDYTIDKLKKSNVVEDLEKIHRINAISCEGDFYHDRVNIATDADPDGRIIRAGYVVLYARVFPKVIDEGKLWLIEPPLFGFSHEGKKIFVSTTRDYMKYVLEKFKEENRVWFNKKELKDDQILDLLVRNERYIELLDRVSDNELVPPKLMELVINNRDIGIGKKSLDKWNELMTNEYSSQIKAVWKNGKIDLEGIRKGRYQLLTIDDKLFESKKMHKFMNVYNTNCGQIYGYTLETKSGKKKKNLSLLQILKELHNYKARDLHRFKGLGEMSTDDLYDTCLGPNRKSTVITWGDVDEAKRVLNMFHSKKLVHRMERKDYMRNYDMDLTELSS